MKKTQGHFFNRMWFDRAELPYDSKREKDRYIPCHEREGFDESKIIKLPPGATQFDMEG